MRQAALGTLLLLLAACQSEPASNQLSAKAMVATKGAPVKKTHLTLADYSYLRLGMLQNEAEEVMMTPGVERGSSHLDGTKMVLYEWDLGANGAVTLRFQEGRLIGKSQYGLR